MKGEEGNTSNLLFQILTEIIRHIYDALLLHCHCPLPLVAIHPNGRFGIFPRKHSCLSLHRVACFQRRPIIHVQLCSKECRQENKNNAKSKRRKSPNEHRTIRNVRGSSNIPLREKRTLFHTMYLLVGRGNSRTPTTPTPTKRTALESTKNSPNVAFYQ